MLLTQINDKRIFYENVRHTQYSILDTLNVGKWIGVIIANAEDNLLVDGVVKKCLDNNIGFVCCAGEISEKLEASFDHEIVHRIIEKDNEADNDDHICTVNDLEIEEALFFAIYAADPDKTLYNNIICIDLTKGKPEEIIASIEKLRIEYGG